MGVSDLAPGIGHVPKAVLLLGGGGVLGLVLGTVATRVAETRSEPKQSTPAPEPVTSGE